ncbi:MAG: hypothetical protein NVS9B15_09870 [Acidobacteriaceae bacterium]
MTEELAGLNIGFISMREQVDATSPLGRAFLRTVAALAQLERSLATEKIRVGMQRARYWVCTLEEVL